MNLRFRAVFLAEKLGRKPGAWLGLVALGLLAGCRHDVTVVPAYPDYFPLVVGTYRTYAVADSSWKNRAVTVTNYQLRERVAEQFADAAGQPAYRLVRSRRPDARAAWADDSVLVVQPLPRALLLTASNQRTVELIYPPVAGQGWNKNAFRASPDTITSLNRYYPGTVGAAYTTAPAGPQAAKTYPATVTTYDSFSANDNDGQLRRSGYQQVYAQGIGRVLRHRYSYYTNVTNPDGSQTPTPGIIQMGASHRETLVETGNF